MPAVWGPALERLTPIGRWRQPSTICVGCSSTSRRESNWTSQGLRSGENVAPLLGSECKGSDRRKLAKANSESVFIAREWEMQELPMRVTRPATRPATRPDRVALEERRMEAARLLRKGVPQSDVARRVGATPTSVWRWARTIEDKGWPGLRRAERAGRPPRLNAAERARVATALKAGALAHGYATDLWTLARVSKLIEAVSGQHYSISGVSRLLQRLGLSFWRAP